MSASQPASVALDWHPPQPQLPLATAPFHQWLLPDGSPWLQFHRDGAGYRLRFPGLADFTVSDDGLRVGTFPLPATDAATVEHLYLNQILPLALSRQQQLVLHGSAVEFAGGAIVFLGKTGQGKSTLAAGFALAGHRFLTDDGAQLDLRDGEYWIRPSHASLRLWDDSRTALLPEAMNAPALSYTPKVRVLAGDVLPHCNQSRLLKAVFLLGDDVPDVRISPVSPREIMKALVANCFLLDIEEEVMLRQHFDRLCALARAPLFFRLDYPRAYGRLPAVQAAIAGHMAGTAPKSAG